MINPNQSFFVNNGKLNILHQNIAGVLNKIFPLKIALEELRMKQKAIDVICLTEHFIKNGEEDNLVIRGYKLAATYSREKAHRGGACILLRNGLICEKIDWLSDLCEENKFECCGITLKQCNVIIVCMYRTPNSDLSVFLHKLELMLKKISKIRNKKIVICGDFNINRTSSNPLNRKFETLLLEYNFKLQINKPTRITGKTSSCIDNIALNFTNQKTATIHDLKLSDHTGQTVSIPAKNLRKLEFWYTWKRDMSKMNRNKFRECINSLSFSEVFQASNANDAYSEFHDLIILFFELCFPLVKIKMHNVTKTKWLTPGIRISSKAKRLIYHKYIHSPNHKSKKRYKTYASLLKKCILTSHKISNANYVEKSKNRVRATWEVIKENLTNRNTPNCIGKIIKDNATVTNPEAICRCFNDKFTDEVKDIDTNKAPTNTSLGIPLQSSIFMKPTCPVDILKVINKLRNTKSVGYDNIPTSLIKENADLFVYPLCHIINLSLTDGHFPDKLKYTVIKPIFKKGSVTDMDNYRPIALIPVFSKIFEKIIYIRLIAFLDKHHVLSTAQFGFRESKSTTAAVYELIKIITQARNDRVPSMCIFMDMSKAFDRVCHEKLLSKLYHYGIRGNCHEWLKSYLTNRQQSTEITVYSENTKAFTAYRSNYRTIKAGVPQGSLLGPLLFLLYINDLPNITKHKILLFADDCSIVIRGDDTVNYEQEVNNVFKDINNWLEQNHLQVNLNKTKIMEFYAPQGKPVGIKVAYNGIELEKVNSIRFLGLIIDTHTNWANHSEHIVTKLSRFAYALKRLREVSCEKTALLAFYSYVMSNLRYGVILWGNVGNKDEIFRLQKKCLRAIYGLRQTESCRPVFIKNKILTFPALYIYHLCLFVKNNINMFTSRNPRPRLQSKYGYDVMCPQSKSAFFTKSIMCMSAIIYNKLPVDLKSLPPTPFEKKLYNWLINKCVYSVSEFLTINNE